MHAGTGKERKERRAAEGVRARQEKERASRPKTARPRTASVKPRKRSCRSCSRSKSPAPRPLSPPDSPLHRTHPDGDRASIHSHAFVVQNHGSAAESVRRAGIRADKKLRANQRAKQQLLEPSMPRISAATLNRLASKAAQVEASQKQQQQQSKQHKKDRSVQAVPVTVSEAVGESPVEKAQQFSVGIQSMPSTARRHEEEKEEQPVRGPVSTSDLRPAGLPTVVSSAREGQRNWLAPLPSQLGETNDTVMSPQAARVARLKEPAQFTVPQPYIPVRSTHNESSFSVFAHAGQDREAAGAARSARGRGGRMIEADAPAAGLPSAVQAPPEHTSSYADLTSQIRKQTYNHVLTSKPQGVPSSSVSSAPLSAWEQRQQSLFADVAKAQLKENTALAERYARRTRPEGAVSWWPDDTHGDDAIEGRDGAHGSRAHQPNQEEKESYSNLERFARDQARSPAGRQSAKEGEANERNRYDSPQRYVQKHTREFYDQLQGLQQGSVEQQQEYQRQQTRAEQHRASRSDAPRLAVSSPERVRSAHLDLAQQEASSSGWRSPFKPLQPGQEGVYAQTFRGAGAAQPQQRGAHEQHRYDLHHRRDSEASEGEYSFRNWRGRRREELKQKRAAKAGGNQQQQEGEEKEFASFARSGGREGGAEGFANGFDHLELNGAGSSTSAPAASSLSRAHAAELSALDQSVREDLNHSHSRQRAAQNQLAQLIEKQKQDDHQRAVEAQTHREAMMREHAPPRSSFPSSIRAHPIRLAPPELQRRFVDRERARHGAGPAGARLRGSPVHGQERGGPGSGEERGKSA